MTNLPSPLRRTLGVLLAASMFFPALPASASGGGDAVVFTGSGWGHGVGMSQYGAYGMALNGYAAASILTHYYTGTNVVDVGATTAADFVSSQAEPLWIGLMQNRLEATFKVTGGGGDLCQLGDGEGACPKAVRPGAGETWVFRSNESGGCVFERLIPAEPVVVGTPGDCTASLTPDESTTVSMLDEGVDYSAGTIRFRPVPGFTDKFHVALQIGVDDYLRGVAEMPTSWHVEALKAQVIAARSYLIATTSAKGPESGFSQSVKQDCWCHLYDDTRSQVYKGDVLLGSASWQTAVSSTTDQVVAYDGTLVTAFYSSSSGGFTENSEDVWTTARPWLRSVDDSWAHLPEANNPLSSWTRIRTRSDVANALGLDILHKVVVHRRASGGVSTVDFVGEMAGDVATVTRSGAAVRSLFGLPSHYFAVETPDTLTVSAYDIEADTKAPAGNLELVSDAGEAIRVKGWVHDPDTPLPIKAHIYVDGGFKKGLLADDSRPDVEKALGNGRYHGFDVTIPISAGSHKVCVYGINAPTKTGNPNIGCKTVAVDAVDSGGAGEDPAPQSNDPAPTAGGVAPIGWIDSLSINDGHLSARGWALDRDAPDKAVGIHIYVDGKFFAGISASAYRPDVDRQLGLGAYHGYFTLKPIDAGSHRVCVFAINLPEKTGNPLLGCQTLS